MTVGVWLRAVVWGGVLALGACNQSPPASAKPLVVASFYPLYEFTRQVAGEHAEVVSLVPPGVEPHDWEPSAQDLARMREARVFVFNGAGLEPWLDRFLRDTARPSAVQVEATAGISLLTSEAASGASQGAARGQPGAPADPHVWLDPVLAQSMVETIRAALAKADPAHAAAYDANARAFTARLQALDAEFERGLRDCARREVVASHAAFAYLARRYRLTVAPVMGLAPESEPTPAQLAAVVRFARQHKVKYIFFETLVSPRLAETLAREVGAQTLVFNPVEGLTAEERKAGKGYLALMEDNLKNLRTALECNLHK